MQTYTQVLMLKHVNNAYEFMRQHEHELYNDDDDVYDDSVAQYFVAACVTDTQVELADSDVCELDNEAVLFADAECTKMYDDILQVYYMHTGNFNYNFYVKTTQLKHAQLVQRTQLVA